MNVHAPGRYRLRYVASRDGWQISEEFDVPAGGVRGLELRLQKSE